VYQDILIGDGLRAALERFDGLRVAVIVLCPRPEVIAARDAAREKTGYPDQDTVTLFDRVLRNETPRTGYWLDNSDLSIDETVEKILAYTVGPSAE